MLIGKCRCRWLATTRISGGDGSVLALSVGDLGRRAFSHPSRTTSQSAPNPCRRPRSSSTLDAVDRGPDVTEHLQRYTGPKLQRCQNWPNAARVGDGQIERWLSRARLKGSGRNRPSRNLQPEHQVFGCQFSYQLVNGTARNPSNCSPVHSVRDRGVGGSNPLAPTIS